MHEKEITHKWTCDGCCRVKIEKVLQYYPNEVETEFPLPVGWIQVDFKHYCNLCSKAIQTAISMLSAVYRRERGTETE
jgi:hypothetical protein